MTTKIEWTDETWNPVTGCTKVSQGCKNCYALRLWPKVSAAEAKRTGKTARAFTDVRYHPERLELPFTWSRPRRVFVNSMSDLFHEDVTDEQIKEVLTTAANAFQHQFQILTKRPARMQQIMSNLVWISGTPPAIAEYASGRRHLHVHRSIWRNVFEKAVEHGEIKVQDDAGEDRKPIMPAGAPENIWLGVSVEDQATADERIPLLLQTPAAVRFVSYEPALGPVRLDNRWIFDIAPRLDWIIAGGESGPGARPAHPDWFRSVRDQCAAAGVAFFFKQWGEWLPIGSLEETKTNRGASAIAIKNHRGPLFFPGLDYCFQRVGKKTAGRQLDGRTHDEYPDVVR